MIQTLPVLGGSAARKRPRLGVFKLASCDGCQLSVLDCEDVILEVAELVDIGFFREAVRADLAGEFDVALVEGSICTPEQEDEIRDIRARSRFLVCLGACASHGGIQALRNGGSTAEAVGVVYANAHTISILDRSRPASEYVKVDLELPGCPINKRMLLRVLAVMLGGVRPVLDHHAVCLECKRQGYVCVVVARGVPCLGPATSTGCGALCIQYNRGCFGCYGPAEGANATALARHFLQLGVAPDAIRRLFQMFYATAPEFQKASQVHVEAG